jgi:hypothetical protein
MAPNGVDDIGSHAAESKRGTIDQTELALLNRRDRTALTSLDCVDEKKNRRERRAHVVRDLDHRFERARAGQPLDEIASSSEPERPPDSLHRRKDFDQFGRRDSAAPLRCAVVLRMLQFDQERHAKRIDVRSRNPGACHRRSAVRLGDRTRDQIERTSQLQAKLVAWHVLGSSETVRGSSGGGRERGPGEPGDRAWPRVWLSHNRVIGPTTTIRAESVRLRRFA